jgi:hypothetical protein
MNPSNPFKKKELSPEHLARCRDLHSLFDAVQHETGMRIHEVFHTAFGEIADKALSKFLMDVATCPEEVEKFCQELLHEKTLEKSKDK